MHSKVPWLFALIPVLTGCILLDSANHTSQLPTDTPTFSGPYADQMAQDYADSTSEHFKKVIFDGAVTEAEYLETRENMTRCLQDQGFTGVTFNPDGTSEFDVRSDMTDDEQLKVADQCSKTTGNFMVSLWYNQLTANPENVDWPSAERDCLVKAGLLEPGTTVTEMNQWYERGGKGSRTHEAWVCSQDALGKLGLK